MLQELEDLERQIATAAGADRDLDRLIAEAFDVSTSTGAIPDYTSSVDGCIKLVGSVLPGWHWHIGLGADGVRPYATLRGGVGADASRPVFLEATAPTFPLAFLTAIVRAKIAAMDNTE